MYQATPPVSKMTHVEKDPFLVGKYGSQMSKKVLKVFHTSGFLITIANIQKIFCMGKMPAL
jgi:hypothetical protein